MMPPFAPPYGMLTTAHFQVIHIGKRLDLVERHVGVVADAALGRPAVDVVLHPVAGEHPEVAESIVTGKLQVNSRWTSRSTSRSHGSSLMISAASSN